MIKEQADRIQWRSTPRYQWRSLQLCKCICGRPNAQTES